MCMCLALVALIFVTSTVFVTASIMSLVEYKDDLFIINALCPRIMDVFAAAAPGTALEREQQAQQHVGRPNLGDRRQGKASHRSSPTFSCDDEKSNDEKEMHSLRAIVDDPITLYCLRMFMTKNMSINNLVFVFEANDWAVEMRRKFNSLCHKCCDNIFGAYQPVRADHARAEGRGRSAGLDLRRGVVRDVERHEARHLQAVPGSKLEFVAQMLPSS